MAYEAVLAIFSLMVLKNFISSTNKLSESLKSWACYSYLRISFRSSVISPYILFSSNPFFTS